MEIGLSKILLLQVLSDDKTVPQPTNNKGIYLKLGICCKPFYNDNITVRPINAYSFKTIEWHHVYKKNILLLTTLHIPHHSVCIQLFANNKCSLKTGYVFSTQANVA